MSGMWYDNRNGKSAQRPLANGHSDPCICTANPDWVDVVLPSLPRVAHHMYQYFGVVCTWASMPSMWANDFVKFAGVEA